MGPSILAVQPNTTNCGSHDSSALLFQDGELVFGVEEERLIREKHAVGRFPSKAIRACLDHGDVSLSDIDRLAVPWNPPERAAHDVKLATELYDGTKQRTRVEDAVEHKLRGVERIRQAVSDIGDEVPEIDTWNHHFCHAASAFYASEFEESIILTADGRGDKYSTVVWKGKGDSIDPLRTYEYPNSLALLYGAVTVFLGFRLMNGEGKVMGLASYGKPNDEIRGSLESALTGGLDYDVTNIFQDDVPTTVENLQLLLDRERNDLGGCTFDQWEKDLAYTIQEFLESVVVDIVGEYVDETGCNNVCLAGGAALNCKMNQRVAELPQVDGMFVQPIANDAGAAIGAGLLSADVTDFAMSTVYWGPEYETDEIQETLRQYKLEFYKPDDLVRTVAEDLRDGKLVGWFQGRLEMGPRALGNRSILADPRSEESKERVNACVKHREEWRPFSPVVLEDRSSEYFQGATTAPFMIETFDTLPAVTDDIPAVLHPADGTARIQTVRRDQNPRYYDLIREFEELTDIPILLNTSFNDSGEPIVTKPIEAIRDFFSMGLDVLVLEDILLRK